MVRRCCVDGCVHRKGVKNEIDQLHKFPKDESRREAWVKALALGSDFKVNSSVNVCSRHFTANDYLYESDDSRKERARSKLAKPKLRDSAIPNTWSGGSSDVLAERGPEDYNENSGYPRALSLAEIEKWLTEKSHLCIRNPTSVTVLKANAMDGPVKLVYSLTINEDLYLSSFVYGIQPWTVTERTEISSVEEIEAEIVKAESFEPAEDPVQRIKSLADELRQLSDNFESAAQNKLLFCSEQVSLSIKKPMARRFSSFMRRKAIILHAVSPKGYESLVEEEVLTLPSVASLRNGIRKLGIRPGQDDLNYMRQRIQSLEPHERIVLLAIDEIYLQSKLDYDGANGQIIGATKNGEAPRCALAFHIHSLLSKYQDTPSVYFVRKLSAKELHEYCLEVLALLNEIGCRVICISVDNLVTNRSLRNPDILIPLTFRPKLVDIFNRRLLSLLGGGGDIQNRINNPVTGDPLFLIVDPTHNFKNLYNQWQGKRIFKFPPGGEFDFHEADFGVVESVFYAEKDCALKMAHRLNKKCLNPSNIERCNAQLSASVFDESTKNAIFWYSLNEKPDWKSTGSFIELIGNVRKLIGVKLKFSDIAKRDPYREPIKEPFSWQHKFLESVIEWFKNWKQFSPNDLSGPTFFAITHSLETLILLSRYCLESLSFEYFLLGKITSDYIERSFSRVRQYSRGCYFISPGQFLQNQERIRATSLMKYSSDGIRNRDPIRPENAGLKEEDVVFMEQVMSSLAETDTESEQSASHDIQITHYVMGAAASSEIGLHNGCIECRSMLTTESVRDSGAFTASTDRGGLTYPSLLVERVAAAATQCFAAIKSSQPTLNFFLHHPAQKKLFLALVTKCSIECYQGLKVDEQCRNSHRCLLGVTKRLFNCLSKNFVKSFSSREQPALPAKIRKLNGT